MATNTEFTIPKDGYLAFDALNLKQFIRDRLNETGIFTDQNYEGSYISTVNEIIAMTFHHLLYYLNRTSTESLFSEAQIYENMNRIVKLLDYKPVGKQTSTLTFQATADETFQEGLYTIPRYSYVENGQGSYSFNEDVVFAITTPVGQIESLDGIASEKLLFQGRYQEYPLYTASGNENEVIFFAPGDNVIIDHFNIDVYVEEQREGRWRQWNRVPSLYLENAFAKAFEVRLNENKRYELKFGNGINGKKLESGDRVAIYYLESNGKEGEIGANGLRGRNLIPFSTTQYDAIIDDINEDSTDELVFISTTQARSISLDNQNISTYYQPEENVNSIRSNAPGIFRSQYRLVTEVDYENYVRTNFANLIHDVSVANNWKYVNEQLRYYYDSIGLKNPNDISNILYNQLNFADGCNFNNVYLTVVPKTISNTKNPRSNLTPAQKELIISSLQPVKTLTSEIVILDPVFIAADLVLTKGGSTTATIDDVNNTELFIEKNQNVRRDENSISLDVYNAFLNYFNRDNLKLGDPLDLNTLTSNILSIRGVNKIYTRRRDDNSIRFEGLSMLIWNPIYVKDAIITTDSKPLEYFKYLFLNDSENFQKKISVGANVKIYETIEF